MSDIRRLDFRTRLHAAVVHNGTVYLTGQIGTPYRSVTEQTEEALAKIDDLLAQAGSDKTKILHATLWLDDPREFDAANKAWDAWVAKDHAPARSTGQARLPVPGAKVEIIVVAAV